MKERILLHMPRKAFLLLNAVVLVTLFSACTPLFIVTATPTPAHVYSICEILSLVAKAPLRDASYSIDRYTFQDVASPSYDMTFTGTGIMTTTPNYERDHITFTVNGDTSTYDEIINDHEDVFIKMATAPDWYDQGQENDAIMWGVGVLPYNHLQHPTVVKADEVIGGVKTWHIKADVGLPFGATGTLSEEIWIREDNAFPAQVILIMHDAPAAGGNYGGTSPGGNYNVKLVFTAWNSDITIDLPYL